MTNSILRREKRRKFLGTGVEVAQIPNLIEVQRASYDQFLPLKKSADKSGLETIFSSVFPISSFSGSSVLEFVSCELDPPKYDVEECRRRSLVYSSGLKVTLRLVVFDQDPDTGASSVKDMKEQSVYMGDIPRMTESGTFIVNGIERVVVSQMHRSPGVFFDHDNGKTHASGKLLFGARIIPYRGSWLDIEFDAKDTIYVRIDRRRKFPVTTLLLALGLSSEEILQSFYNRVFYVRDGDAWRISYDPERLRGMRAPFDLIDADTGELVASIGTRLTARVVKQLSDGGLKFLRIANENLLGQYLAEDLVNLETGEIYAEAGEELSEKNLAFFDSVGIKELPILDIDHVTVGPYIRNTLVADRNITHQDALFEIYRVMRPGDPPTVETAQALFQSLFFDSERYDLSAVGRVKMNMRLELNISDAVRTLQKEDILSVVRILVGLRDGRGDVDDIDHLGNRRVRSVGELMENQYRLGLLRMERSIKERMSSVDIDKAMPQDLINAKPVAAAIREFFGASQLSQFMDQTNPLSEVTHKRRLSALGVGGLTRDRATLEVRDVHPTHYGRICPIETPEGPNIGLINSLATFARVNRYGFIESPYRRVKDKKLTDEVVYLSAMEEARYNIAQANVSVDTKGYLQDDRIVCRKAGEVIFVPAEKVDYVDVSPKQIVSVAASLIPFLENDDANRALMGSNMQRQAVPLLRASAPLVGTGMEAIVAADSGAAVSARRAGVVDQVDSTRIVVLADGETHPSESIVDIYRLRKFQGSNQNTCINQRPLVRVGDRVEKNEIIADGPATDQGELALGQNLLVAFMPWNGYNFEDSILLSERLVKEDRFTSIHIESFEVTARDTKLGPEEVTRDIPNISDGMLKNLDETGIVYVGAEVQAGDVLVGKVTPKGESPMTPEEKLLRAIFGEKASDVRDTSLRVPPGVYGTVVDVRVFTRHGVDKDQRAQAIEREEIDRLTQDRNDEQVIVDRSVYGRIHSLLLGKTIVSGPLGAKKGQILTEEYLSKTPRSQWWTFVVDDIQAMDQIVATKEKYDEFRKGLEKNFWDKVEKLKRGDELPPGVMKTVKVFIAVKRKIQPGDKMAGRHGNKGVVSKIVPVEDMPFLEDGTPVDIVLNPLGVPSRMNVGQILETHLGWASAGLGRRISEAVEVYRKTNRSNELRDLLSFIYDGDKSVKSAGDEDLLAFGTSVTGGVPFATPVFSGAKEKEINRLLEKANFSLSGQTTLYDGRTGESFDRQVTIGYIYMLKLCHLVDDKIHARSVGPYSLVTQQPLGGKAQFGGQRFGEMEVWALEAYGAAYTLQEILTVKSDDIAGRTKVYEAIVNGDDTFGTGIPESFNVLTKEIRSLGLNVELLSRKQTPEDEGVKLSDVLTSLKEPASTH
jgi:DNA-directed RNA polymerase subunit beta